NDVSLMETLEARLRLREKPHTRAVMRQDWEHLLFLHWRLPAEAVQRTLPEGLYVDTFDDSAWVGVVPFAMRNVRPVYLPPVPGISNFLELNVRTYVHDGKNNYGVWFYSLEANQALAVWAARKFFNLNYLSAKMQMREDGGDIIYSSQRTQGDLQQFHYRSTGIEHLAAPGSLEFFLIERYLLFSLTRRQELRHGRVHHSPYLISTAEADSWSAWGVGAAGLPEPQSQPDSILYSKLLRVNIFGLTTDAGSQT
ncbi:MAG: DUF2071 domain-containing protein, partial [Chthoniobacterales bacterium]